MSMSRDVEVRLEPGSLVAMFPIRRRCLAGLHPALQRFDALFIKSAMLLYRFLANAAVGCVHILSININMIEQLLFELIDATVYIFYIQREILVALKNHILEA